MNALLFIDILHLLYINGIDTDRDQQRTAIEDDRYC